jgi:hypothetical protein
MPVCKGALIGHVSDIVRYMAGFSGTPAGRVTRATGVCRKRSGATAR